MFERWVLHLPLLILTSRRLSVNISLSNCKMIFTHPRGSIAVHISRRPLFSFMLFCSPLNWLPWHHRHHPWSSNCGFVFIGPTLTLSELTELHVFSHWPHKYGPIHCLSQLQICDWAQFKTRTSFASHCQWERNVLEFCYSRQENKQKGFLEEYLLVFHCAELKFCHLH